MIDYFKALGCEFVNLRENRGFIWSNSTIKEFYFNCFFYPDFSLYETVERYNLEKFTHKMIEKKNQFGVWSSGENNIDEIVKPYLLNRQQSTVSYLELDLLGFEKAQHKEMFSIVQVCNAELLTLWCDVFQSSFRISDLSKTVLYSVLFSKLSSKTLHHYLLFKGNTPSSALTTLSLKNDEFGIYNAATMDSEKGIGAMTYLVQRVIEKNSNKKCYVFSKKIRNNLFSDIGFVKKHTYSLDCFSSL